MNDKIYYVGVCHPIGMSLHFVLRKDIDWFYPFVTAKNADGPHSRVLYK